MINKLVKRIAELHAPIVVGLDPTLKLIPEFLQKKAVDEYGITNEAVGSAIISYNKKLIDSFYDLVPAVKPQIAMYEQYGLEGLKAYKETIDYAHSKGLIVIGDVKRGDIGSTSEAYANAHLGSITLMGKKIKAFDADFATVNPYLGTDGIKPFLNVCKEEKKGIFVLVKTSNPSSGELQDRLIDGEPLYEQVAKLVDKWGAECMGDAYSYVGAVTGATYPEMGARLRKLLPKTFFLVPGYGAQGGTAKDLQNYFNADGSGAIVNSSRGIIGAYKTEKYARFGEEHFDEAARQAVLDMKADINM